MPMTTQGWNTMSETVRFKCKYGATDYSVTVDLQKSQYYGKIPSEMRYDYLPYYSTIDDEAVIDIARQLDEQLRGRRDFIKVSVLLTFVQQNVKYVSDEERFGKDVWETPIYVLRERVADCDGMASLYVSIAYNMGIDVISVIVTGHMCPAVNVQGCHGKKYIYDGMDYIHVETTDRLPAAGRYWGGSTKELLMTAPKIPTDSFVNKLIGYM